MKVSRREFVVGATLAGTVGARAQAAYPERQITAICNFPAGTGADTFVRYFGGKLSEILGKPVVTDNRGGALGNIATEAVAKSKPDGYTLLTVTGGFTIFPAFYKDLAFDIIKDFAPVSWISSRVMTEMPCVDSKMSVRRRPPLVLSETW